MNDEPTNAERIQRAQSTCEAYKKAIGEAGPVCADTLSDLLADLMHMAKALEFDFDQALGSATDNYSYESQS